MDEPARRLHVVYRSDVTRRLDEHADELVRRYASGESTRRIAEDFGCADMAVAKALRRAGVAIRSHAQAGAIFGMRRRLALPEDEIVRLYLSGATVNALARQFTSVGPSGSCSRIPIQRILRERGIPLRSSSDDMRLRWQSGLASVARPAHTERRVMLALRTLGVEALPHLAVGECKVDLALLEPTRLAVEIQCSHHSGPRSSVRPERLEQVFNAGFAVLVVWSKDPKRDPVDASAVAQQMVAFQQALGGKPSPRRQYGVIGSDGQPMTPRSFQPPQGTRVQGF